MSSANHGYDLVARGLIQALGGMLDAGKTLAPVRAIPAALADLCRQAKRWDHALRVEIPAGNFSSLMELPVGPFVPVSIRRRAADKAILHVRRLIGQGQPEQAERLAQKALKQSPDHPGAGGPLGHAFYSLGRTHQALEWFEREPEWQTHRTVYTLSHCMLLIELRKFDQARILLGLLSDMESSPNFLHHLQFSLLKSLLPNSGGLAHGAVVEALRGAEALAPEPIVPTALHPYSTFLMRRAESPDADPFDQYAAGVLAAAMLEENEIKPYPSHQIMTLARWLVLARRSGNAVQLIEERSKHSAKLTDAFASLCLFLWICGEVALAREYLPRVDCASATSDMGWFIRSVACAVAGDTNRAAACLSSLFQQAPGFFEEQPGVTVWGMLALLLKALGHDSLGRSARSLAARKDPWDFRRVHLWDRVSVPQAALPFPRFPLPAGFNEQKS
jgi:hypothetical protein